MTDKLARVVAELDTSSAEILRSSFNALFDQADEWIRRAKEVHVTSVEQKREMKLARESRLALKELRVKAEHTRKKLKEDSVRYGRAIDGIANVLKALLEPVESYLLEQETFAARIEALRSAEQAQKKETVRAERVKLLEAYGVTVAEIAALADLSEMTGERWRVVAEAARQEHADRQEIERREREALEAAQRTKSEILRQAREEAVVAEKERLHADNERLAKIAAEAEEAFQNERRRSADLERVQMENRTQEAARAAAEEALRMAPDREKLRAFAEALKAIPLPVLTTRQGRIVGKKLASGMKEMVSWVQKVSEEIG